MMGLVVFQKEKKTGDPAPALGRRNRKVAICKAGRGLSPESTVLAP